MIFYSEKLSVQTNITHFSIVRKYINSNSIKIYMEKVILVQKYLKIKKNHLLNIHKN
jgi:hypothetical protein